MKNISLQKVKAVEVKEYIKSLFKIYNHQLIDEELILNGFSSIVNLKNNTISWARKSVKIDYSSSKDNLFILEKKSRITNEDISFIEVENPRLVFAKLMNKFVTINLINGFHSNSFISKTANIGKNVIVGAFSYVGNNVSIGDNTTILQGVVISDNVIIGEGCFIKSNSVIGEDGFGNEFDQDGKPIDIPHIGSVIIGNNVRIGSLNTIVGGTIDPTIIEDYVKTDDHVHIAHNVKVGESSRLTACVEISGSVSLGKKVWLGPNCSIIDGISIGDNAFIGLGAVVTKSISSNVVAVGNPAKVIKKL